MIKTNRIVIKMPTYKEIYNEAKKSLEESGIECVNSEILNMFWYLFGIDRSDLIIHVSDTPNRDEYDRFCETLKKRCGGMPLQYAVGRCNFMDMDLYVGEGVLIPREDTSVLVNASLSAIKNIKNPKIIDLCSGSGCIALALERSLNKHCDIHAVEISERAFKYLSANHDKYGSNINLINDDIFSCYKNFKDGYIDLIVSNPPYIKSDDIPSLQREVLSEPQLALDGGKSGLEFYRKICEFWIPKLKSGGTLAFEIGRGQYGDVKGIMESLGITNVKSFLDINGIYRAVVGEKIG
ncbi:MAG: peptide chain release factor N(5)-glutamine methyltransferase [Clostridia bacterium]|nr:peptide chain release factor N(5)-glutamine methyltransferase [Clostridia bacterium]